MKRATIFLSLSVALAISFFGGMFFQKMNSQTTEPPKQTPVLSPVNNIKAEQKVKIPETFKNQMLELLTLGSQFDAKLASDSGISDNEFSRNVAEIRGKYDVVHSLWPENVLIGAKADLNKAVMGWIYVEKGLTAHAIARKGSSYNGDLYDALVDYSANNPFGIQLAHYTNSDGQETIIIGRDWGGTQLQNLITIGCKYFRNGRDSILKELNQ